MQPDPIEGTLNFRAVAPYRAGGGPLKTGSLYRSGEFSGITSLGIARLREIGVTTLFDLRGTVEREHRPSPLSTEIGFVLIGEAHDIRLGDLHSVLADSRSTAIDCAEAMKQIYADLPSKFASIFRRYILVLAGSPAPVAVHCAAGKDRTGVAIALVLALVGVNRDDIMEDYLESNAVRSVLREQFRQRNVGIGLGGAAEHLVEQLITVEPGYLDAMFARIFRDYGDIQAYAHQALQLTEGDLERLRRRLVA